jgi:hypothetical protein
MSKGRARFDIAHGSAFAVMESTKKAAMKGSFKSVLIGPDGMLRPIWRAAIFYAVGTWFIFPVLDRLFNFVAGSLHLRPGFTAANLGFGELLLNFSDALICTGAFALYERRRIDSYGLPVEQWQRHSAHSLRPRVVGYKHLCWPRRGILVPVIFSTDALEKHWLLARLHRHSSHLCRRALLL